jgi:hypothetical protein
MKSIWIEIDPLTSVLKVPNGLLFLHSSASGVDGIMSTMAFVPMTEKERKNFIDEHTASEEGDAD